MKIRIDRGEGIELDLDQIQTDAATGEAVPADVKFTIPEGTSWSFGVPAGANVRAVQDVVVYGEPPTGFYLEPGDYELRRVS